MIRPRAMNANAPRSTRLLRAGSPGLMLSLLFMMAPAAVAGTGSTACLDAASGDDAERILSACTPGREAGNLVDGYNLAIGLRSHDPEASLMHLRWAADGGLPEAAHLYGNVLIDEGAVERGLAQLAAAAQAGLVAAQYDYATALLETRGTDQRDTIFYWYAQAAANGDQSARYNMGVLHLEGHLEPPDRVLAWAWFSSLAALEGHPQVYRLVNRLTREMSREERSRGEELLAVLRHDPMALFD